jgi:aspartyl-tRNA(Asn)/glutamyl-tRNA(Gln) amidotransferase subunit B
MMEDKTSPAEIMKKHKIAKKESGSLREVEHVIKSVLEKNAKAVQDYKSGEEKALHYLVGLSMKATKGVADANEVRKIIRKLVGKR